MLPLVACNDMSSGLGIRRLLSPKVFAVQNATQITVTFWPGGGTHRWQWLFGAAALGAAFGGAVGPDSGDSAQS